MAGLVNFHKLGASLFAIVFLMASNFVQAQAQNNYGLDPGTVQNPFYSNSYLSNTNNYYPSDLSYYGNIPNNNYYNNYYPTPPPPSVALPANTAPPPPAPRGGEMEVDEGSQPPANVGYNSGFSSQPAIPAQAGYPTAYGDWNLPAGGRLYSVPYGDGVGLLESRSPRFNYYNNYNGYNSYQQQNNFGGMDPFVAMWAFDMW